jgi:tight adherence protein C
LFTLAYVAARAPSGDGKRLGLRGLKRRRALESVPLWASLEPLVRWLGARCAGLCSERTKKALNRKISVAGDYMGLLPEEVLGLSLLTTLLGVGAGAVLGRFSGLGNVLIAVGGVTGALAPVLKLGSTATTRTTEINRRLPYAIDLLSLSMGAGLDFPGAVSQVIAKSGSADDPVIEEFTLILQSLQLGRTRKQCLEEFAARVPIQSVLEFVGAVLQAELRGTPIVDVLRIQAEVSRQKRTVRAEESASRASVAMTGPLLLAFVAILILIVAPMAMKIQF